MSFILNSMQYEPGPNLFNILKGVKVIQDDSGSSIEFQSDGSQRFTTIKIMNLQSEGEGNENVYKRWEEIGTWQIHPAEDESKDSDESKLTEKYSNFSSSIDRF